MASSGRFKRRAGRGSRAPRSTTARRCDRRTPCRSGGRRTARRRASGRRRGVAIQLDVLVSNSPSVCSARYCSSVKQLDAHRGRHLDGAALRLVLLAGVQRLAVVAEASAAGRALGGAVAEDEPAGVLVAADHVRLAAGGLHRAERRQRGRIGFEPGLNAAHATPSCRPGLSSYRPCSVRSNEFRSDAFMDFRAPCQARCQDSATARP